MIYRSLTHTKRDKLRTTRGYEREIRRERRLLFCRDYDQPNDVEALGMWDSRSAFDGDYWSTFRR